MDAERILAAGLIIVLTTLIVTVLIYNLDENRRYEKFIEEGYEQVSIVGVGRVVWQKADVETLCDKCFLKCRQ